MFHTLTNLIRALRLCILLLLSGVFLECCRKKTLPKLLQRLGPSFVKFGQTLSVRPDIVGEETALALSSLRDNMPPFAFKTVRRTIEKELGQALDVLFKEFEKKPVAAASIAQVHKAILPDGTPVAVKILRPKIVRAFMRDIGLFYFIAHLVARRKSWQRLKLVEVVDTFADSVKKELDLRMEAASASQLKENCKNDKGIHIPSVFWQATSRRVLTLEWVEGIPVHDTEKLKAAGHDLKTIATHLSVSFFNQAYRDGFFHADVHPGNLFVNTKGEIVPVDFGIMGRLDSRTRLFVAEILRGFLEGDYEHVAKIHLEAGYVPSHHSVEEFTQACRAIGEPIMNLPADKISVARLLALLFKITEDFDMETQPQLLLLQKTLMLVEGVGAQLYPEVNLWELARPWIKAWGEENLSPRAKLQRRAAELVEGISRLPALLRSLDQWITDTHTHGLRLHPETLAALKRRHSFSLLCWQSWLWTAIIAATVWGTFYYLNY